MSQENPLDIQVMLCVCVWANCKPIIKSCFCKYVDMLDIKKGLQHQTSFTNRVLFFGPPKDNKPGVSYSARVRLFTYKLILSDGLTSNVGLV